MTFYIIGLLVLLGVVLAFKFVSAAKETETRRRLKEQELEELQREYLIRYAYNRKDSVPVDDVLTSMILQDIMNSDQDVVMGTVTYDSNNNPTIHKVPM